MDETVIMDGASVDDSLVAHPSLSLVQYDDVLPLSGGGLDVHAASVFGGSHAVTADEYWRKSDQIRLRKQPQHSAAVLLRRSAV